MFLVNRRGEKSDAQRKESLYWLASINNGSGRTEAEGFEERRV